MGIPIDIFQSHVSSGYQTRGVEAILTKRRHQYECQIIVTALRVCQLGHPQQLMKAKTTDLH